MNIVVLKGNLTRDPEHRINTAGTIIVTFSIAVKRVFGSGDDRKEEVSFFDIVAFNRQGENIVKYFAKGDPILVRARAKQETWETKEGDRRHRIVFILEQFEFCGSRRPDAEAPPPAASQASDGTADAVDEDVPF